MYASCVACAHVCVLMYLRASPLSHRLHQKDTYFSLQHQRLQLLHSLATTASNNEALFLHFPSQRLLAIVVAFVEPLLPSAAVRSRLKTFSVLPLTRTIVLRDSCHCAPP